MKAFNIKGLPLVLQRGKRPGVRSESSNGWECGGLLNMRIFDIFAIMMSARSDPRPL